MTSLWEWRNIFGAKERLQKIQNLSERISRYQTLLHDIFRLKQNFLKKLYQSIADYKWTLTKRFNIETFDKFYPKYIYWNLGMLSSPLTAWLRYCKTLAKKANLGWMKLGFWKTKIFCQCHITAYIFSFHSFHTYKDGCPSTNNRLWRERIENCVTTVNICMWESSGLRAFWLKFSV